MDFCSTTCFPSTESGGAAGEGSTISGIESLGSRCSDGRNSCDGTLGCSFNTNMRSSTSRQTMLSPRGQKARDPQPAGNVSNSTNFWPVETCQAMIVPDASPLSSVLPSGGGRLNRVAIFQNADPTAEHFGPGQHWLGSGHLC